MGTCPALNLAVPQYLQDDGGTGGCVDRVVSEPLRPRAPRPQPSRLPGGGGRPIPEGLAGDPRGGGAPASVPVTRPLC